MMRTANPTAMALANQSGVKNMSKGLLVIPMVKVNMKGLLPIRKIS
jgi:hypothetical protein